MSITNGKRVVLCDDHEIVRDAIKSRMANNGVVEIVGEAGDGREVVDVVKELDPDVVIIDVEMPKRDGIEATKEVLKVRPRTKVIIFTAHAQPDLLALALRAGASAAKKYDCEAWIPSQGRYRELTSCSNTTDYQARRLSCRYRASEGESPGVLHTLNGTALAVGRTIIALIENRQERDGAFTLPSILHSYGAPERIQPR